MDRRNIIGNSKALCEVLDRAGRVARTNVAVLIEGETGTGKELFARYIHDRGSREDGPFVAVNCAAIPKDLLEAELFGAERGAFTGALATRPGAFERAHGGTLFLDEIGDMALEHQAKVLRVLQEGEVQRVGGAAPRRIDVRVVAATHRVLLGGTAFRDDLYYRLAGYTLRLPPLRARGRDIVAIAKDVLQREFPTKTLSRPAQVRLLAYAWPGNVRELENVIRSAAIDARGRRIDDAVLRRQPAFADAERTPPVQAAEDRRAVVQALLEARGRITAADVRGLFQLQKAHAYRLLAGWERTGDLARCGSGRGTFYVAKESPQTTYAGRDIGPALLH